MKHLDLTVVIIKTTRNRVQNCQGSENKKKSHVRYVKFFTRFEKKNYRREALWWNLRNCAINVLLLTPEWQLIKQSGTYQNQHGIQVLSLQFSIALSVPVRVFQINQSQKFEKSHHV